MKTSDIPDEVILNFLYDHQGRWTMLWDNSIFSVWVDDTCKDYDFAKHIPNKLLRSKMKSLYKRELVGGCACGCRGDFEITDKGLELLSKPRLKPYSGY